MQLIRGRARRFATPQQLTALLAALLVALLPTRTASADETSGTWTGALEGRGNYYWERSTRVIVPAVAAELASPAGVRVGASYLLDVITSASIASGVSKDGLFTETRNAFHGNVGDTFELGNKQLEVSLLGGYSTENDYTSLLYGFESSLSLNDKDTKLSLFGTRIQDHITSNADATFDGHLDGLTTGITLEQVINPVLVLSVGYQLGYLHGFLGNAYRRALFASNAPEREAPPESRVRHSASARLAWMIPETNTALHLLYTAYADSWDIAALSPEVRVYQQFGRDLLLRPRYRLYTQTHAYFAPPPDGKYPAGYTGPTTNDPKLTTFHTHTLGLAAEYRLSFLTNSVFDFAKDAWIDIGFDRYWNTNAFGNGIIATAGGRITF